jgi:hypothetical protein
MVGAVGAGLLRVAALVPLSELRTGSPRERLVMSCPRVRDGE